MEIISLLRSGFVGLASKSRARLASAALVIALVGCRKERAVSPTAGPAVSALPAADAALPAAPRGREIALLYSSNLQGKYAPCNCAVQPLGGLARRATVTARARAEADATLVVDAGDLFQPAGDRGRDRTTGQPAGGRDRARRNRRLHTGRGRSGDRRPAAEEGDRGVQDPRRFGQPLRPGRPAPVRRRSPDRRRRDPHRHLRRDRATDGRRRQPLARRRHRGARSRRRRARSGAVAARARGGDRGGAGPRRPARREPQAGRAPSRGSTGRCWATAR